MAPRIGVDRTIDPGDKRRMNDDARRYAAAAARNQEPILDVLRRHLPQRGLVLEIASGSGEHIAHFARASDPDLMFQPSDPDPAARASIDAWTVTLGLPNIRPAVALDAASDDWCIASADVVLCINMIHIAPWTAAVERWRGVSRFHLPLIEPDGRISRIRLSDKESGFRPREGSRSRHQP